MLEKKKMQSKKLFFFFILQIILINSSYTWNQQIMFGTLDSNSQMLTQRLKVITIYQSGEAKVELIGEIESNLTGQIFLLCLSYDSHPTNHTNFDLECLEGNGENKLIEMQAFQSISLNLRENTNKKSYLSIISSESLSTSTLSFPNLTLSISGIQCDQNQINFNSSCREMERLDLNGFSEAFIGTDDFKFFYVDIPSNQDYSTLLIQTLGINPSQQMNPFKLYLRFGG